MGGYQFPDIDNDAIIKAAKLKAVQRKLKKKGKAPPPPPAPSMGVKPMNPDGSY